MGKKKTGRPKTKKYEEQLIEKYGDNIVALEPYVNLNTKILHKCNKHNYEFLTTPASAIHSKNGCPLCGKEAHKQKSEMRMAFLTDDDYKKALYEKHGDNIENLMPFDGTGKSILHICHKHNYQYTYTPYSVLRANGCKYCGDEVSSKKQLKSFNSFASEVKRVTDGRYELLTYNGMGKAADFRHICLNGDIHYFTTRPTTFRRGTRCYCESGAINHLVVGFNDIATKRPDLVELLYDKNDAIKYTHTEKEKIRWVCPNCGHVMEKYISDVSHYKLSCDKCSDGILYPNKFMFNSLLQIIDKLDFLEKEFNPSWCKYKIRHKNMRGKYDIYFGINGVQYIIEMDGGFHNRKMKHTRLTLDEIQLIDKLKDIVAENHGIHVIRIDCDYKKDNRYEYIKHNISTSELSSILDLSSLDFDMSNKEATSSLIVKAAQLWNEKKTLGDIMKILHIGDTTLRSYLVQANKIGICDYVAGDGNERIQKQVIRLDTLQIYKSITLASNETDSIRSDVGKMCRKQRV